MAVKVTGADASDHQGARRMLEPAKDLFGRITLVWGDSHYGGTLIAWMKEHLGWKVEVVRGLITAKGKTAIKEATGNKEQQCSTPGFPILPRRWVIERSLAWIIRWRRLARDHEGSRCLLRGVHQALGKPTHALASGSAVSLSDLALTLSETFEAAQGVLLGFGTTVEVLEPQELRDSMGDQAAAIAAFYGKEIRNS